MTLIGGDWERWQRLYASRWPELAVGGSAPLALRRREVRAFADRAAMALRESPDTAEGLFRRLCAVMAWASLDVRLAVTSAGHLHAAELLPHRHADPSLRESLWAVWLPDRGMRALTALPVGPAYRLTGILGLPVDDDLPTHAVVVAEDNGEARFFAVDLSHASITRAGGRLRPPGDSGAPDLDACALHFHSTPVTPVLTPVPPAHHLLSLARLGGVALLVGAASGVIDAALPPGADHNHPGSS